MDGITDKLFCAVSSVVSSSKYQVIEETSSLLKNIIIIMINNFYVKIKLKLCIKKYTNIKQFKQLSFECYQRNVYYRLFCHIELMVTF